MNISERISIKQLKRLNHAMVDTTHIYLGNVEYYELLDYVHESGLKTPRHGGEMIFMGMKVHRVATESHLEVY